jgi:hypothetical protein
MRDWRDVPMPRRIRSLQRDARGYPLPFIVLRDTDGVGHLAVNDETRWKRCVIQRRCPICGNRLDRVMWLVGGALSAFHERGAYRDSGMHQDCMEYALVVCPYLALPRYLGRIDAAGIDPAKIPDATIFIDPTMIPDRPPVFVAVATMIQTLTRNGNAVWPRRPYLAVQYWRAGERLPDDEGKRLADEVVAKGPPDYIPPSPNGITDVC